MRTVITSINKHLVFFAYHLVKPFTVLEIKEFVTLVFNVSNRLAKSTAITLRVVLHNLLSVIISNTNPSIRC